MNYKLTLQYDGTDFHGWQVQDGQRTVQGDVARVLGLIEGEAVVVHGSGRTDAGVHALGQVASVQLTREISPEKLRAALNGNLERDVRVIEVSRATDDFHARYSAQGKSYLYRIFSAPVMSPFWNRFALHEARPLDVKRMQSAARLFLGEHDWTAFSSAQSDAQTRVRTITELEVTAREKGRAQGTMIEIRATANGFLRYMVRSIAGTLTACGRGEIDEETIARAINGGDRSLVSATAPPHGLTLMRVHY
jgi:tRNA pseudouridine38-40 synthase